MFTILLRKMRSTKWMVLCLFIGFLMAAGMMSTVPIYMDASLQRMLIKDMEEYQVDTGEFPGIYSIEMPIRAGTAVQSQLELIDNLPSAIGDRVRKTGISPANSKTVVYDNVLYLIRGGNIDGATSTRLKMVAMTDLQDHITITKGRMYCEGGIAEDGAYEVIIAEPAIKSLGVVYGNEYDVTAVDTGKDRIKIRIVGVYEQLSDNDTYWSETMSPYINAVMTDFDCFKNSMLPGGTVALSNIFVRYALDYQTIDMNSISSIVASLDDDFAAYDEAGYEFEMPMYDTLVSYQERAAKLTQILWVLQIPVMVMLAFYLFMVSQLNVEQEKNEIAVFKSRGASSGQIFGIYAMEAGALGLITLIAAPFIGLFLCQFLGVSNGFLEFVNRTGIAAKVTGTAVLYALLAVVIFFVTTMIPIIPASKLTIVQYKQSKTKVVKMSLWEKLFVDVILIAAAVVFLIIYTDRLNSGSSDYVTNGEIDPLIFVFATAFVMGMGLLFIRLYPYLLRLIYTLFKPFWTPSQYMAITTVARSQGGKERFLMLFLVITFSFGLFSANTARAINNNKEDRIYYSNGADITLSEYWTETSSTEDSVTTTVYTERDFSRYEELAGVEQATKVLKNKKARFTLDGKTTDEVMLMGIQPDRFAQVAWFRNDLLPVHWYNYCNALTDYKSGVLVSRALADDYEIVLGDEVAVRWGGNDTVSATVLAVVDYWPGINPNETSNFVVMNYNYCYTETQLEPYEVWLKLADGATSEELYADITAKKMPVEWLVDSSQLLIAEKNEPQLQGMNGALTLGFIIIMIMTIIGFLIYWILSIKSRTLQFGILRAMGVTFREIIGIIGYEQILVSGVSIAIAFVIGGMASDLFVPLFQMMYDVVDQIPPFFVSAAGSDYVKIYAIIVLMLGGGFAILGHIIKKININKALKLGED